MNRFPSSCYPVDISSLLHRERRAPDRRRAPIPFGTIRPAHCSDVTDLLF